ncbi:sugar phosphate isomerase/epimerase [archaeon]|nr:MAG: sugar phosphate isomerase/epimerase [archaeon]
MKFGNLTNPIVEMTEEIRSILNHNFDYVEIGIEWPEGDVDILKTKKKAILDLTSQFDAPPIGHTAWWMDFSSLYEGERLAWIREAKRQIDIARDLDIGLLNFHSHSVYMDPRYGKYKTQALDNFVLSMREIIKYADNYGIQVIVENPGQEVEIAKLKDYSYVMKRLPQAKVHLDIGHAFMQGGMKSVNGFIKTFNKRIVHLHVHDNHGEFDEHIPIGNGKINYPAVVKMLKKIKYDRTATFEVFTSRKDAEASMNKIKKMWK